MSEETESSPSRKRRVIHWNPEAGEEQRRSEWTWRRLVLWTVGGGIGLLFAVGLLNRASKALFGVGLSAPDSTVAAAPAAAAAPVDPNAAFITQAKAEQAHELASKSLAELRRMPSDHPVQLQQMILLEKSMIEGETLLRGHEFARANAVFATLNTDIDAFAKNMKAKGEARQGYDKILLRIKDLEIARELAPGTLDTAFEAAGAGRQLLNDGNFTGAMKEFERGYAALRKAEAALADHVRANLVRGQRALAQGAKTEAMQAFKAALEKAPGTEAALLGLKRAENIDRVHALLLHGAQLEQEKQYALAADAFGKAFALDGQSAEAQQGQARAARLEKETRFASAKSAADQAVQRRDWEVAIREFQNALKVYPQKTDVQAALKAAREQAHKESVQKMLAKGYAHEDRREWKEAREAFNAALELEPGLSEAKEAYTRAGTVIRALLQYERLIETAEQLANRAEFQAALKRFNEALANKPSYLEPSERVIQLRKLLQEQSKPVEVAFKSDGKTWFSITNFKTPIQTDGITLKIYPGDYEVIGRRKGYRDIRMILQVRAGVPLPEVAVVCDIPTDKL